MSSTSVPANVITAAKQVTLQTAPPKPYQSDPAFREALSSASVSAFHAGILTIAGLLMAGGVVSLVGIQNSSKR
jgi:hypothetical protein